MITALLLAAAIDSVFFASPVVTGRLARGLEEASGLVASQQHPGLFWTHNDSGDGPVIYGIDSSGRRLCAFEFSRGESIEGADWEDIAYGKHVTNADTTFYVFVGDIGDNNGRRESINIYRSREHSKLKCLPALSLEPPQTGLSSRRSFVYPDGARDAETLLFDPLSENLYIVTKRETRCRLYSVPKSKSFSSTTTLDTLVFVMELPFFAATGGDISSDGREILIKTYTHVYRWTREPGELLETALARVPTTVNYVPEPQGEAICFNASGAGFYTLGEAGNSGDTAPLYYYARTRREPEQGLTIQKHKKRPNEYTINYKLANRTPVALSVHNELMMTVKSLVEGEQKPGAHKHKIDMSSANPGIYVVVLRHGAFYNAIPFTISAQKAADAPIVAITKRKRKTKSQK